MRELVRRFSIPVLSFAAGAFVMGVGLWAFVGVADVDRVPVSIYDARLVDGGTAVELSVGSCQGAPSATITQGETYVEIDVRAFRHKTLQKFCDEVVTIGVAVFNARGAQGIPTEILDIHTGRVIEIN